METYGKKKKTLMGSFATLRNSEYNKSKKNRANRREPSTRQLSAFHPTSGIEKQDFVEKGPSEEGDAVAEEPIIHQPHNTTTTIEDILPQLPSLNFSEQEMWIAGKGTTTGANDSNIDCHTGKVSHTRKNSAPPIPRKSSKRQSALAKTARRRSPTKDSQTRRFPKEPISRVLNSSNEKSHPAVSPSDPSAINASVAQTLKAMEELKPGSTKTLVVEKKRRLKAGAFLKVKSVLQGSFRRRKNDITQEDSSLNPSLVATPQVQEHIVRRSESVNDIDLRLDEVQNLKSSAKLENLTGNPRIHRKPLNNDERSFHSQHSALADPFIEPRSSSDQTMPRSIFNSQMLAIGSLPEFSSPPRTNKKVSSHRNNKGFDDLDSLLTSSPLAQSTPRLRLECNHTDPDRTRRMQKVDAGSPSVLDHNAFIENSEVYQGMLADSPVKVKDQNQPEHRRNLVQQVGMLREKTVNNFVAAVQTLSGSASDSGFAPLNRKWKKNPSPSKARLEELSKNLPYFPEPEPILYRAHKHRDSNDIHKATFALREKRKHDDQENKELLEGLLTSDEDSQDSEESEDTEQSFPRKDNMLTRVSASLPLINLSSRPISASQSSPALGVEGLEVGASVQPRNIMDQDDSMMDLDELQLVTPPLPTQSFHSNESCDDLIAF
ncbi:b700f668-688b-4afa-aeaf-34d2d678da1d [Sclerotinia trifoliorum]|uniref:B700f668-688b-4afa-aeaf-34d2d678da1d n=1 Tax=Sclerotinia trifoliorum TaxID=28548 RepID=A0A8H2ZSB6_9HELO|nr:b700f668-688b-4afa-aeaf-34d2d678da1d [Sclerotinia trifoliorum]